MSKHPVDNSAVVTFWFVTAADPASVIRSKPRADRGFGRKLLAQLNPYWPITPIGQFTLNRSVPASTNEFYISGFAGVTIIQTRLANATSFKKIDNKLRTFIPASDIYIFAVNEETTLGGFAHFVGNDLKRSFVALDNRVHEDIGVPGGFEASYWAGEHPTGDSRLSLPFHPIDLVKEAQRAWLNYDAVLSPNINVAAFAVDGRPEPKILEPTALSSAEVARNAAEKLSYRERNYYDDYEEVDDTDSTLQQLADRLKTGAVLIGRKAGVLVNKAQKLGAELAEKLRHTDR